MIEIGELLKVLSNSDCIGSVTEALNIAKSYFSEFCDSITENFSGFTAVKKGRTNRTLLLDAHIDEVGFIVTNVEGSFLTVSNCGGNDIRILPASSVKVHGKKTAYGEFVSTPPHLSDGSSVPEKISELKVDVNDNNAKEFISPGDYITYDVSADNMMNNRITGKALDNRAGVTALIKVAEKISKITPEITVLFQICGMEELGLRGSMTSSFLNSPDEAVAVDVSFGDGPDISKYESKQLGTGAMIGISPVLSKRVTDFIKTVAEKEKICHTFEVMGGKTGTDADIISVTKGGIPTGLISIPIRNMHTPAEVVDTDDISDVVDILYNYIILGGAFNA